MNKQIATSEIWLEILKNTGKSEKQVFEIQSSIIKAKIAQMILLGEVTIELGKILAESRINALKDANEERKRQKLESQALERAQALVQINKDLRTQAFLYKNELMEITKIEAARFDKLGIDDDLINQWKNFRNIMDQYGDIINGAQSAGEDFFESWITGSKSMGDAWDDMLGSMINTLNRFISKAITDMLLFQAIIPFAQNIGASLFRTPINTGTNANPQGLYRGEFGRTPPPMGAHGGIFNTPTIGGESGAEAFVPVPSGKIPVELRGGGAPIINFIDQTNKGIDVTESDSFFDGEAIITNIIIKDLQNNGQISQTLNQR